jgi:Ca2+-binding EF-hand superfamily protein
MVGTGVVVLLLAALLGSGAQAEEKKRVGEDDGQDLIFFADSRPVLIRVHVTIDGKSLLKTWNEFINDIFDRADVNKDGVIDKNEATRVPSPQELFNSNVRFFPGGGGGFATGLPAIADSNGDGKITREELADYYRKSGGAPLQLAQASNNNVRYRRAFLDTTGRMPTLGEADALNKALFALLDTNKDGKLSRKELEAAPAILLKKDADDDEMVTIAELQGQADANTGYEVYYDGGGLAPLAADGPLMLINPRESNRALADTLLRRYGHSAEAKKTGKLTAKDLGMDADTFKKLDVDEDGLLDREELARFARRTPDAELTLEIGANPTADLKLLDKTKDLRIEKTSLGEVVGRKEVQVPTLCVGNTCLALKLGGVGGNGSWAVPAMADEEGFYKMQFAAADADNNGYLDMNEARRNGFFASNFKAMDADGDGKLYLKEVLAFLRSRKELRDRANASCASLTFADQGRGLFDLLDVDGDGRLSVREMRQAAERLLKLDRDGDGCLSLSEIPRRYQLGAQKGPTGGNNFGGVVAFTTAGRMAGPLQERKEGPLWFRKMDRNRDGDVSRREFLGTDEQFRLIDKDGDGLISAKEAQEFDDAQRKKKEKKASSD